MNSFISDMLDMCTGCYLRFVVDIWPVYIKKDKIEDLRIESVVC